MSSSATSKFLEQLQQYKTRVVHEDNVDEQKQEKQHAASALKGSSSRSRSRSNNKKNRNKTCFAEVEQQQKLTREALSSLLLSPENLESVQRQQCQQLFQQEQGQEIEKEQEVEIEEKKNEIPSKKKEIDRGDLMCRQLRVITQIFKDASNENNNNNKLQQDFIYTEILKQLKELREYYSSQKNSQDSKNLAWSLADVGHAFKIKFRPEVDYLPLQEESVAMYRRIYKNKDNVHLANSMMNLGVSLEQSLKGRVAEGVKLQSLSLQMRRRLYPMQKTELLALSLQNVGGALLDLGGVEQQKEGLSLQMKAKKMFECLVKSEITPEKNNNNNTKNVTAASTTITTTTNFTRLNTRYATSLFNVGIELAKNGLYETAIEMLEKSFNIRSRMFDEIDFHIAISHAALGFAKFHCGRVSEAIDHRENALKIFRKLFPLKNQNANIHFADCLVGAGEALLFIGRRQEGNKLKEEGIKMVKQIFSTFKDEESFFLSQQNTSMKRYLTSSSHYSTSTTTTATKFRSSGSSFLCQ